METLVKIGLATVLTMAFTPPQSAREFLQHLVGQHLILRHYTGSANKIRKECDLAVEVKAVAFEKASVRVRVRNIGTPSTVTGDACANVDEFSFEINGLDMEQPPEQAKKTTGYVLQTPEAYLAELGIPWHTASFGSRKLLRQEVDCCKKNWGRMVHVYLGKKRTSPCGGYLRGKP